MKRFTAVRTVEGFRDRTSPAGNKSGGGQADQETLDELLHKLLPEDSSPRNPAPIYACDDDGDVCKVLRSVGCSDVEQEANLDGDVIDFKGRYNGKKFKGSYNVEYAELSLWSKIVQRVRLV